MAATKYPNNLEIQINEPIDTRMVCDKLADLTEYLYEGLLVYCKNDEKYYSVKSINNEGNAEWEELKGGSEYISNIKDSKLEMPNKVGGIQQGTKLESLTGKTFTQLFDDLLFPTITPTYTQPSATINIDNKSSQIREIGTAAPKQNDFTLTFNKGTIKVNGVTQSSYSGDKIDSSSYIYVNNSHTNRTLPETVPTGTTTYYYHVEYEQGPIPKDNKGNEITNMQCKSGSKNSTTPFSLYGAYPIFTTSDESGVFTKNDNLQQWTTNNMTYTGLSLGTQPDLSKDNDLTKRQGFKIPLRKVKTVNLLNTVSGNYEVVSGGWTLYDEQGETIDINGINVKYYTYYNPDGASSEGCTIEIIF